MPFGRPPRRIWTGAEFDQLVEQGMFDGQRVELIDGEILEMPPMNDPHAQAVQLATHLLISIFPATAATTRVQLPMRLGESRPLPDLAIVAGTPRQIVRHPETALLVIEVSDSTLDFDRDEKAKLYARNSLPEYWIVNLPGRCLEVHRSPVGGDADPRYGEIRVFSEADVIAPLAAPEAAIRVADLLP
jgi:Uma2 family endonuclease